MDAKNQFTYFLLSVATGFVGGSLYELFAFLRLLLGCERGKRKMIGVGLDVTFFLLFTTTCIYASYLFHFPTFRVYMWVGWLIGGILYSKTLRRIVAFFEKVCYNILAKLVKKSKSTEKTLKKERIDIYDTR